MNPLERPLASASCWTVSPRRRRRSRIFLPSCMNHLRVGVGGYVTTFSETTARSSLCQSFVYVLRRNQCGVPRMQLGGSEDAASTEVQLVKPTVDSVAREELGMSPRLAN